MNRSTFRLGLMALLIFLGTGCAHQVAFQDVDYAVDEDLRSEPLVTVISEAERTRVVPVRSFMTGIAHSWEAEPGVMLVQVAEIELPQMFERHRLAHAASTDGGLLHLHLSVPRYLFEDFKAKLTMHARLVDENGNTLLDELYEAEGPGRGGRMFFGGAFAMKSAMRTSSLEAFKIAFESLRADLGEALDARDEG
ncbi:hypothetical protein [Wenzhouxiangella marina]|uniref:Uncharacterized protein n=1 Tax=Wenzhouxiangella marina TaxID=1579979 RepID=A0A0K0Y020_9GAMM|nr:hypothetical protein [Wenzhouxiangella marina]AKS43232.1 hypothetical protein WM2015_2875 [Wenzhouxiangella marina]MBB6087081.1 hypothetical protein [Wenzhouxiangella marina]